MSDLYPPRPAHIPEGLTRPSGRYRAHAWGAFAGLVAFLGLYFGLAAWFAYVTWTCLQAAVSGGERAFLAGLLAIPAGFLLLFMTKGLFFIRRGSTEGLTEISEAEEPALFAFVHRVADEAGAPRPHRIFLSPRVNAAVFYDLGFWNLVLPSKKNLEIGLGLVNVTTLDEFKAVIAHEFGHFAQGSMRVGRWVYLAQQFTGDLITRRDGLDRFLDGVSRIDLRIAWIGWLMRLVVWSLRALLDTAFRLVILLHRALSREMEFQADLVSASLCGSDSLVHALHRLGAADEAWDKAARFCAVEAASGRPPADLFTVQTRLLERLGEIRGEPAFGLTPPLPEEGREGHRVFEGGIADAPRMWSTHPSNPDREANAKARYVPSPLDERPAWALFSDPVALRAVTTQRLFAGATEAGEAPGEAPAEAASPKETLARLDTRFNRPYLDQRLRGAYLDRSLTLRARQPGELYDAEEPQDREATLAALDGLYPEALADQLGQARALEAEAAALEGLKAGVLRAPGGVIRFRGEEIRKSELGDALARVQAEREAARGVVDRHDRRARSAHRAAARLLGGGWVAQLEGLLALLHYTEHSAADLEDAASHVGHVLQIVTADKKITQKEMARLVATAQDAQQVIARIYGARGQVRLGPQVAARLEVASWSDRLPDQFGLPVPDSEAMAEGWLGYMDSWSQALGAALEALRQAVLDALVTTEAQLARALREGLDPGEPPAPPKAPLDYPHRCPGDERPRQARLGWWDRFQVADGPVAGAARLTVASAVLAPALFASWFAGTASLTIHNGLAVPVTVALNEQVVAVPPLGEVSLDLSSEALTVVSTAHTGEQIESFAVDAPSPFSELVYNIGGGSAMVEWTVSYGAAVAVPEKPLGAPRWFETTARHVFEEPPGELKTSSDGATRLTLTDLDGTPPQTQLEWVQDPRQRERMVALHARWEPLSTGSGIEWLYLLKGSERYGQVLAARLAEEDSVALRRLELDAAEGAALSSLCEGYAASAAADPGDADAAYLSIRCMEDGPAQDAAFLEALGRSPGHRWLAWASGLAHAGAGRWSEAATLLQPLIAEQQMGATFTRYAADVLARCRRALVDDPAIPLGDLYEVAPSLEALQGLERGEDLLGDPYLTALLALHSGQWQAALSGRLTRDDRAALLRMVAASDGAPEDLVAEALALEGEAGVSPLTAWTALALAAREGADRSALVAAAEAVEAEVTAALVAALEAGTAEAFEAAAATQPPMMRGQVLAAGLVLLGDEAPAAWRREVRALLFMTERPYFEPAPQAE